MAAGAAGRVAGAGSGARGVPSGAMFKKGAPVKGQLT